MNEFLQSTAVIDWQHSDVLARARSLASGCEGPVEIAQRCFEWVRDEIKHSLDHGLQPVTCSASEVLKVGSGFCYAKSHLLAALLRANGIPAALCYQRLACNDEGTQFCLHGLNAIHLPDVGWYRVDARGNRADVDAQFAPPIERLAFKLSLPGETDVPGRFEEPLPEVFAALTSHGAVSELKDHLPDLSDASSADAQQSRHSETTQVRFMERSSNPSLRSSVIRAPALPSVLANAESSRTDGKAGARMKSQESTYGATRLATHADATTLAELAAAVFREAYRSAFDSDRQVEEFVAANFTPAVMQAELEAGRSWYSLGFVNGVAAGFIKLESTEPPECVGCRPAIELAKLYVLRSLYGCGIAHELMQQGLDHASRSGATQVWLCVWEKNARAIAFYRRWGFETVGEKEFLWSGVLFRDAVMTRNVNPALTRDTYSVGYDDASAEFFGQRRAATHARFFLAHLTPGMKLLDAGCGPGTITVDLARLVAPGEVVGVDLEPSQIELAQARATAERIENVRFQAADIYSLPFGDDSFDAVFLHGVLEHLTDPIRALHEVRRVLQPGGVLGSRHADFGGFLLEQVPPPLNQFVPLFERLMLHNGADPRAGRHQLRWLIDAGFTRIKMSASYDCWTSTPEEKRVSARFLQTLVSDSDFARQLLAAGLADRGLLEQLRLAFADWEKNPVSFAAEAWTEAVAWKTRYAEKD